MNTKISEDYKEDHEGDLPFVEEMYLWLADEGRQQILKDWGINTENEDTYIKRLIGSFNKYEILFNFGYAENRSTENGYDDGGVEVNFWYDADSECFVNFHYEQW